VPACENRRRRGSSALLPDLSVPLYTRDA
jgi:hypothetical protein